MATDRRAAIRDYKDNPRPMGLYGVRNVATGRTLIGSTVDLPAMLNRQRFQLELGGHPVRALQADWDALGPDSFEIEVLDTLERAEDATTDPREDLAELLDMWRERLLADGCELY